jgi:phosphopantetheinyl transferase (holo-ACP synthase)
MTSGNDIVYLQSESCKERNTDERFKSKILNREEAKLLDTFENSNTVLWLMWSVKEAAFKCCSNLNSCCIFSPTKFRITQLSGNDHQNKLPLLINQPLTGTGTGIYFSFFSVVEYHQTKIFACSAISQEFIFSIACHDKELNNIKWGIQKISTADYQSQSESVRKFLLQEFIKTNPLLKKERILLFKDKYNRPFLSFSENKTSFPVSFSHHHQYISYTYHNAFNEINSKMNFI